MSKEIEELINVVSRLRDPQDGCPWDIEQNHKSLIPYLLEESNEVVDAIRNGSSNDLREELGDLLLQIILHAQIAKEQNNFSINEIAKEITNKLIRRHPHVFKKKRILTTSQVKSQWEKIKNLEKPKNLSSNPLTDEIKRKIRSQESLNSAMIISNKVAKLGFEWNNISEVWKKLEEEIEELKKALNNNEKDNAESEIGDVIFTLINIARWSNLNPSEGLAKTNKVFLDRFAIIEKSLRSKFTNVSKERLKELWQNSKQELKVNK